MTEEQMPPASRPAQTMQSVGILMMIVGVLACAAASTEAAVLGACLLALGAVVLIAAKIAQHHSMAAALLLIALGAGAGSFFCFSSFRRTSYMRRAAESSTRVELAGVRAALAAYRDANSWQNPRDLGALNIRPFPAAKTPPYHRGSSEVRLGASPDDSGGWIYDGNPKSKSYGQLWVNCTHTDSKGQAWTSY